MQIKLTVDISSTATSPIRFAADLAYSAPSSVFGTVTVPDGSFDMIASDDRVFAHGGAHWIELAPILPLSGSREYEGGLANIGALADALSGISVDTSTENLEKIHGTLSSIGFSAYIERLVEAVAIRGLPAYFAKAADVWLFEDSGLPARIEVSGNTQSESDDRPFRIRMEFSDYGSSVKAPPIPDDATPYVPTELATLRTPTPGTPQGCAVGVSAAPQMDDIGRVYHQGDALSVTMDFTAPGCKNVSADFRGQFLSGSPRYNQVCRKQCGESVFGTFQSGQVPLPGVAGAVVIDAKAGPFPPVGSTTDVSGALEGFRLCEVTVTFNDGAIGGTFYNVVLGNRQFELGSPSTC